VDKDGLAKALREAARVLRSGGILYVSEPSPSGDYFEVMKPVHDETVVRTQAQEALRYAPEYGLLQEHAFTHIDTVRLRDFAAFHDRITSINPHVRERFEEADTELRASFESHGRQTENGWEFDQPTRVVFLRRS
jgi:SAM-dependent methyltransferase